MRNQMSDSKYRQCQYILPSQGQLHKINTMLLPEMDDLCEYELVMPQTLTLILFATNTSELPTLLTKKKNPSRWTSCNQKKHLNNPRAQCAQRMDSTAEMNA